MGFDLWQFLLGSGGSQALTATAGVTGSQAFQDANTHVQAKLAASDPMGDFLGGAGTPPPSPDFADSLIQRASMGARLRARAGFGQSSTFLTGAGGDSTSGLTLKKPTLLGGG